MKKEVVENQIDWVKDPQNTLITLDKQANANIQALALQLGYDGSLTVGALEDEIRFYQRRTVEACLELGKRLLILKEITPHGEFIQRVELLGFAERSARRFMQAALKTSKSATVAVLAKISDHSGKFLELITLDDDELTELTEGGSARGITLDTISTMSVTELRKALRNAKSEAEAKDVLLAKKDEKLNELDTELTKRTQLTPDAQLLEQQEREHLGLLALQEAQSTMLLAVQQFHQTINAISQNSNGSSMDEAVQHTMNFVYQSIAEVASASDIAIDFTEMVSPSWLQDALKQQQGN